MIRQKWWRTIGWVCALLWAVTPVFAQVAPEDSGNGTWVVQAKQVYVGDGTVIEGGMLIIRDGVIVAIGKDLEIPSGARVVEVPGGTVTPGLIDANARIESENLLPKLRERGPSGRSHLAGTLPGTAAIPAPDDFKPEPEVEQHEHHEDGVIVEDGVERDDGETPPGDEEDGEVRDAHICPTCDKPHKHASCRSCGPGHDCSACMACVASFVESVGTPEVTSGPSLGPATSPFAIPENGRIRPSQVMARLIRSDYTDIEENLGTCGCTHAKDNYPEQAASGLGPSTIVTEQAAEILPHTNVLDAVDLQSPDFERLLRAGVTTVYVSPDSSAVIGCRGAVVQTGGADRVLRGAAAVKATLGNDPIWLGSVNQGLFFQRVARRVHRRPTTRMGVTWVFRKAFHDTIRRALGVPAYGADTPSVEASEVLAQVLRGEVGLRIQAREQIDISAAIRLANEFGLSFLLEEATEAYRCLDELELARVPVVFGPIFERPRGLRAQTREAGRSRYHTFRSLLERGIPTALSAQELREEDGLARQCMYAMRFGVSEQDALQAVTSVPARLLGIEDQVGTLAVGKRADVVVWSGAPFSSISRPAWVCVGGEPLVSHPRWVNVQTKRQDSW